jgi:hypothetical protein
MANDPRTSQPTSFPDEQQQSGSGLSASMRTKLLRSVGRAHRR